MKTLTLCLLLSASAFAQCSTALTNLLAYGDASTLAASNGASVSAWTEILHGYTPTQATTANQPIMRFAASGSNKALEFYNDVDAAFMDLAFPGALTGIAANNYGVFVVANPMTQADQTQTYLSLGGSEALAINNFLQPLYAGDNGTSGAMTNLALPAQPSLLGVVSSGSTITQYVNEKSQTHVGSNTATSLTGGIIGAYASNAQPFNGLMYEYYVYSPAPSSGTVANLLTCVHSRYPAQVAATRNVVAAGNSITAGLFLPAGNLPYPNQIAALLPASVRVFNEGYSGESWAAVNSNIASYTALCTQSNHDLMILFEGTNSILAGLTAAQVYTAAQTAAQTGASAGCAPIILTTIHSTDFNGGQETIRQASNALLLAGTLPYAVVDVASITQLSNDANGTYFLDGTHLTQAGYAVLASAVAPYLSQAFPFPGGIRAQQ